MATYTTFVAVFPEFSDAGKYPQTQVDFWLAEATNQLSASRFKTSFDLAQMLFTAHYLALGRRDQIAANGGGVGGASLGMTSSKTVDKVSVSYDTASTALEGAGEWNATAYGQRLYRMILAVSTGPFYVPGRRRIP